MARNKKSEPAESRQVVTIQKTGKRLKGRLVISFLLVLVGAIMAGVSWPSDSEPSVPTFAIGILLVVIGALGYLLTRIAIWWHHA